MKRLIALLALFAFVDVVHAADNYTITEGAGRVVLADEVGAGIAPRCKVFWGIDGAGVDASDTNPLPVNDRPVICQGWTPSKTISAASTNATSVKASAGLIGGWVLSNNNASPRYLKLYNKASAPTVGTDVPVMTIEIPGNSSGILANAEISKGVIFSVGLAFALTTGMADTDNTGVAANEIIVNLLYK